MRTIEDHALKNIVDAVVIPGGVIAGLSQYIGIINGVMTFLVLLTSLIWGVYRIIDMRMTQCEKRKKEKDEKNVQIIEKLD